MKKVLAFAAFALLFVACNSVEKYKPAIDELSKTWDSTTSQVTEFANTVKTEQANWSNAVAAMNPAADVMAKWDDTAKAKFAEIQAAAQGGTTGIAGIASELDGFISEWTTKGNDMKALIDGLAAGKIEGDVQTKIADLTAASQDATSKLAAWTTKFEEVKAAAAKAQQMYADFMAAPAAPATAGKK